MVNTDIWQTINKRIINSMGLSIVDALWIAALVLSIVLNFHLVGRLSSIAIVSSSERQSNNGTTIAQPSSVKSSSDALPKSTGRLSHVIIEIENVKDSLSKLDEMFAYWQEYPPCATSSKEKPSAKHELVILSIQNINEEGRQRLEELYQSLPSTIRKCFSAMSIVAADFPSTKGAEEQSERDKGIFSLLLNNTMSLNALNHGLYINPTCIPVQKDWLGTFNGLVGVPNELFWMQGSILRGARNEAQWPEKDLAGYVNINRYCLYNFQDPKFGEWYHSKVIPHSETHNHSAYPTGSWEMDIFNYLYDLKTSFDFQWASSKFRLTNIILNMWNTTYKIPQVLAKDPDTLMICNGRIDAAV